MITNQHILVNESMAKRRQQNQKFPSIQIFRFAAGGVGGAAIKNDRKFLGFAPREQGARGRGACLRRGFGRQASVIRQNPADFVRNTFELRPIHTARYHFNMPGQSRGARSKRIVRARPHSEIKIIIVGGGFGGVRCATQHFPNNY